jgi:deazaflavin-dependent oxidoreductase (nitroreductase family)
VKLPGGMRYFNKYVLNRVTGKVARSPWGPFCIIYHVGRRSGKPYETTIIAIPTAGSFVIALTYGPDVDWFRNVSAAGGCKILWHRQIFTIERIEAMEANSALPYFPGFERMILRLVGIQHFIRMAYPNGQNHENTEPTTG